EEMDAPPSVIPIARSDEEHAEERSRSTATGVLRKLAPERPAIVVTRGGIVLRAENVDLLKPLGIVIGVAAEEATVFDRASRRNDRPLLQKENPRAVFSKLFRERESLYAAAADLRVDTSTLTHDEVAETILNRLEEVSSLRQ